MNPPSNKDVSRTPDEIRGPEIGPAIKRDRLLQRVQAARKRVTPERTSGVLKLP